MSILSPLRYGRKFINEGDEILISADGASLEHRSVADRGGGARCKDRVIPMNERGELIIEEYENLLNERTKIVAVDACFKRAWHDQSDQGNDRDGA